MLDVKLCPYHELQKAFAIREEVFINEQGVPPKEERDGEDDIAFHFIAMLGNETVGCGRAIISNGAAHFGRIAVKKEQRSKGVGKALCEYMLNYCFEKNCKYIWLNSQVSAVGFYEKLGFKAQGNVFFDAGIEHVKMIFEK